MDFDVVQQEISSAIPEDEEVQYGTPQAQLLAWHYRLGHMPFAKIQRLAKEGYLPRRMMKCEAPRCASCAFGKATKRPWRTKAPVNKKISLVTNAAGDVVAMDQLVSSVPGLIGQMRGFLTRKRFMVSTVFVDHFSGLSFEENPTFEESEIV